MERQSAIAYVRVSTVEQGRSGLGLEAQRAAIARFAETEGLEVTKVFEEVETGVGTDALERRPQLAAALKAAREIKAAVLVAKIDRLSRDVHFISGLMTQQVEFIATDLGRQPDPFVLHLYAALAQKERQMISARTIAGLAAATARGTKLGMAAKSKKQQRAIRALAFAAKSRAAEARATALQPHIEYALKDDASLRKAAQLLNERGIQSPGGGRWHAPSLLIAARRLGLR
jgi:DNA invertase Pin-like site-specific DNA recombinase